MFVNTDPTTITIFIGGTISREDLPELAWEINRAGLTNEDLFLDKESLEPQDLITIVEESDDGLLKLNSWEADLSDLNSLERFLMLSDLSFNIHTFPTLSDDARWINSVPNRKPTSYRSNREMEVLFDLDTIKQYLESLPSDLGNLDRKGLIDLFYSHVGGNPLTIPKFEIIPPDAEGKTPITPLEAIAIVQGYASPSDWYCETWDEVLEEGMKSFNGLICYLDLSDDYYLVTGQNPIR